MKCLWFVIMFFASAILSNTSSAQDISVEYGGEKYQIIKYDDLYKDCCTFTRNVINTRPSIYIWFKLATVGAHLTCKYGLLLSEGLRHPEGSVVTVIPLIYKIDEELKKSMQDKYNICREEEKKILPDEQKRLFNNTWPVFVVYGELKQGKELSKEVRREVFQNEDSDAIDPDYHYFVVDDIRFTGYFANNWVHLMKSLGGAVGGVASIIPIVKFFSK